MYILWSTLLYCHLNSCIVSAGAHSSVPAARTMGVFYCVAFADINSSVCSDINYLWNNSYISYHFLLTFLIFLMKQMFAFLV